MQRLPHRLNRLTGHLAARLMTKVATWLLGQGIAFTTGIL